ncbi:hypothetical protein [Chamaesiphon sp.]|uniref:hypothetical protein n=1 Tax=Chamaesiphon sp. TaxID=2814140 RepID=UPI003593F5B9
MIYRNVFLSVLFSIGYLSLPVRADTTVPQLSQEQLGTVKKALSTATFANSPPTTTAATYVADPRIPQIPSFSYAEGTPLPKAVPGAMASMMGASKYSPQSATTDAGGDPNAFANTKLTSLPFFGKLPFASVVAANPQLAELKVGDVFPSWGAADPSKSVADVANSPLGKTPLPPEVLASTPTSNLLGVTDTPYGDYPGIGKPPLDPTNPGETVYVADMPGVSKLSWDKFVKIGAIPSGLTLLKFDLLHSGQKELSVANSDKVAAGSNKEPNAPCKNCDAVELLSAVAANSNLNPYNGTISPIGLRLKGGEGLLGDLFTAAGVREDSGFEVPYIGFGDCGSKWSARSPNVQAGTFQQTLSFRYCYTLPFLGFQATPYFLALPLPLPANEKQANLLLPMKVKPVANKLFPSPTIPSVPSIPSTPSIASVSPSPRISPTIPSAVGIDKVALFGSATKNSYSPTLNVYSDGGASAKLPAIDIHEKFG